MGISFLSKEEAAVGGELQTFVIATEPDGRLHHFLSGTSLSSTYRCLYSSIVAMFGRMEGRALRRFVWGDFPLVCAGSVRNNPVRAELLPCTPAASGAGSRRSAFPIVAYRIMRGFIDVTRPFRTFFAYSRNKFRTTFCIFVHV